MSIGQSSPGWAPVDAGLRQYLETIRRFPILSREEESRLARLVREEGDRAAADTLITSHLRLVGKVAMRYRGYGLPMADVIEEGNVGLIRAPVRHRSRLPPGDLCSVVDKATIQEYVLRSWSLVKLGTTANQKKLFFGLRRTKSRIAAFEEGDLHPDHVAAIAIEVVEMNRRMNSDGTLNAPIGGEHGGAEWLDWLVDDHLSAEAALVAQEQQSSRTAALGRALIDLGTRERRILEARRLSDEPLTLEALADEFGVSRERIRQIEVRAFEKLRASMTEAPGPGVAAPCPLRRLGRGRATLRDPAMEAAGRPPVAAA
jgi:RNA polymerase sigma-32 factor